jgi:hypothetical protein
MVTPPVASAMSSRNQLPASAANCALLIAQCVSDRHDQVAAKVICGLATLIFDSVVAGAIAKLPILEFTIAVMDNFSSNFPAEKIIQSFGFGRSA